MFKITNEKKQPLTPYLTFVKSPVFLPSIGVLPPQKKQQEYKASNEEQSLLKKPVPFQLS